MDSCQLSTTTTNHLEMFLGIFTGFTLNEYHAGPMSCCLFRFVLNVCWLRFLYRCIGHIFKCELLSLRLKVFENNERFLEIQWISPNFSRGKKLCHHYFSQDFFLWSLFRCKIVWNAPFGKWVLSAILDMKLNVACKKQFFLFASDSRKWCVFACVCMHLVAILRLFFALISIFMVIFFPISTFKPRVRSTTST